MSYYNSQIPMPFISDLSQFAKDFAQIYFGRGFGSMNKNDLEVLIFYLLKKHGDIKEKSNFQLARELHLSEAKVKRLAYEAELSYGNEDKAELQSRFLELLGKAKIQKDNGTLRFVVEDKYLRSTVYEDLKQMGYFLDTSFNSEIVSIQKEALIALLDSYYSDKQKDEMTSVYKDVRKKAGKDEDDGLDFKGIMSVVFDKLLEKGVDAAVEGAKGIDYGLLIKYISSGFKAVKDVIGIIATVAAMA